MPYENEYATGESLWRLLDNESVKHFQGEILVRNAPEPHEFPPALQMERSTDSVNRIIAIDGSDVTREVQNGFPRAEASLVNLAGVVIKTDALRSFRRDDIPSPSQLRDIEAIKTMSAVLPGPNVVGKNESQGTPTEFFRWTVRKELEFRFLVQVSTLSARVMSRQPFIQRTACGYKNASTITPVASRRLQPFGKLLNIYC